MGQVLTIVNIVLTLLDKFVQWGARTRVFKEDEAIIALTILRKANEDIRKANEAEKRILDDVTNNPTNIVPGDDPFNTR